MEQRIAVPAYFDSWNPDDRVWDQLTTARGVVSLAVFDDWDRLAHVKPRMLAAGIKVFGRVLTHKATVERSVCQALIDEWFRIHPDLDGIFVGEGPPLDADHPENPEPDWVWNYYGDDDGEGLYRYIKSKRRGASVFLDCPGCLDERVLDVCDIAQVVRVDYGHYTNPSWWNLASRSWWTRAPSAKTIAHVIHSCPATDRWSLPIAAALSKVRRAELVYIFDGDSSSFRAPPAYWEAEVSIVSASPADPCEIISEVVTDMSTAIDDLAAALEVADGTASSQVWSDMVRLGEKRTETEVMLNECHSNWDRSHAAHT